MDGLRSGTASRSKMRLDTHDLIRSCGITPVDSHDLIDSCGIERLKVPIRAGEKAFPSSPAHN
jgi:hypothetical protein